MTATTTSGLFGFRGRIGRLGFLGTFLPSWLCAVAAGASLYALMERGHNGLALGVSFPLVFLAGYLGVAAGVKRCHDLNKTGYTYLLSAVPLLGLLFILYLLFAKGDSSSNRFGPPSGKLLNAPSGVAPTLPTEQPLGRSHLSEIHDVKNVPSRTGATEQDALTLIPAFDEDEAYTRIALEIETKSTDKGLWLKAMVQADSGDGRQQAIAVLSHSRSSSLLVYAERFD